MNVANHSAGTRPLFSR